MEQQEESKYIYPVEEIDSYIQQINDGMTPIVNPQLALEIKIRQRELMDEIFDEDDPDVIAHKDALDRHIEAKKREASKKDVMLIKLTPQQRAELEEDMKYSIVRPDPMSAYNKSDEELFNSAEKKRIVQRLSRIRNCYYNPVDYRNAINIIMDAIRYAVDNEYPWLPRKDVIKLVNEGRIKFTFCNIPKLYLDYRTQVTDPAMLKGIVSGDITIKDANDIKPVRNKTKSKGINYDIGIITSAEYKEWSKYHKMGYDTPISPIISNANSSIYQFSMPFGNNPWVVGNTEKEPEVIKFDWMRDGAGEEYFKLIHGDKTDNVTDFINYINEVNDREVSQHVKKNLTEFMSNLRRIRTGDDRHYNRDNNHISSSLQTTPEAVKIEEGILNALRMNNPNL